MFYMYIYFKSNIENNTLKKYMFTMNSKTITTTEVLIIYN